MITQETINNYGLEKLTIFDEFSKNIIHELTHFFHPVHLKYGEVLLKEGEENSNVYILVNGRISFINESQENCCIKEFGRGDILNATAIVKSTTSKWTAIAIRSTFLLKLSREAFEKINQLYPKEGLRLLQKILENSLGDDPKKEIHSIHNSFLLFFNTKSELSHEIALKFEQALSRYGSCLSINQQDVLLHSDHLESWLAKQHSQFKYILYEAYNDDDKVTESYLHHCDRVLLFCDPNENLGCNAEKIYLETKQLSKSMDLVLIQKPDASYPSNTINWIKQLPGIIWHHIRGASNGDIQRIARIVSGNSISLVLGGGGAKTLVFIGLYKALKELGIPVDWVGGSCAGAIITSGIATNMSIDEMIVRYLKYAPKSAFHALDATIPFIALSSGESMSRFFADAFGDLQLEDLWINNFTVTTNLTKSQVETIHTGPVWKALRAATGIPIFLHPISNEKGELLVDGAIMNNLPVDLMKSKNRSGKILAGRIITRPLRSFNLPVQKFGFWNYIKAYFSGELRYSHLNLFKVLDRTTMLASRNHADIHEKLADYCMHYEAHNVGYFEYGAVERLIELGYRIAMEHADELVNLKLPNKIKVEN